MECEATADLDDQGHLLPDCSWSGITETSGSETKDEGERGPVCPVLGGRTAGRRGRGEGDGKFSVVSFNFGKLTQIRRLPKHMRFKKAGFFPLH